jgi:hypothetical protein
MALKISNPVITQLAAEVAALAGENQVQAIRRALEERRSRMLRAPLRSRVLTRKEVEELLSFAPGP